TLWPQNWWIKRHADAEHEPAVLTATDSECTAQLANALLDAAQAEVRHTRADRTQHQRRRANPVVMHRQCDTCLTRPQADHDAARVRMLLDVGESFAHDTKHRLG